MNIIPSILPPTIPVQNSIGMTLEDQEVNINQYDIRTCEYKPITNPFNYSFQYPLHFVFHMLVSTLDSVPWWGQIVVIIQIN